MTVQNAITYHVDALGPDKTLIFGSFRPQAAGALVAADTAPTRDSQQGFSVARSGVGLYTVTFDKSHTDLEACFVSARKADGTAMVCQGGDYSASNRTLQIRTLVDGGGAALTKCIQLPLSGARATTRICIEDFDSGSLVLGSTPPTLDGTAGGLAFDADAELAYLKTRLPDQWGADTSLTCTLVWHPQSGTVPNAGETVIWNVAYRTIAPNVAVDTGVVADIDATYTQAGAGTDKQEIRTDLAAMTYNHATQPIAAGDTIYMTIQRDKTGDTYPGDAVLTHVELRYNQNNVLLAEVGGVADGPYISRVNGGTDPLQRVVWATADVTPLTLPSWTWPPDTNAGADATVHLYAACADANVVAVDFREGVGDANAGGNTAALAAGAAEVSRTIAHADITGHPLPCTVTLTPAAHAANPVYLYSAWVEYTSTNSPAGLALADLADDVDNRISFLCIFRDSTVGGAAAT